MNMELLTTEYGYGLAKQYAERSDREALLWSVLKWLNLSTIHESELSDAWHTICGLCWRHSGGRVENSCVQCPLTLAGNRCLISSAPWPVAQEAYEAWKHIGTEHDLKEFRKAAREFTRVLARIYNDTYPDQKIKVDFEGMKLVSTKF
jgi:hypothetical protein